ncbi:TlpA family protein disulfide reductase [Lewinella sp. LCG006]|uniref:TlpA family protein disulfide reductase n=1 Tax=Lewinella sp. LCG006 TaxID=3231911 RepID=UPI0034606F89
MTKNNLIPPFSILLFCLMSSPIFAQMKVGDTLSTALMEEVKRIQILNKEGERVWSEDGFLVVKFWATWCTPCVAGFPKFDTLYTEFVQQGVDFIAVSDETTSRVEHFLSSRNYQFPVGVDNERGLMRQFGVRAIPEHLVIDESGIIRYRGGDLSSETLVSLLQNKEVPEAENPSIDFDNKEMVISNGYGAPGQDPVYNGMQAMMAPAGEEWSMREDAVEQVIVRKSLETAAGWYGYRTSGDYIGLTYSSGTVNEIYSFLLGATSPLWVVDSVSGGVRYDFVYWKKNKKKIPAFKKEMLVLLENALHIGLRKRFIEDEVVMLRAQGETPSLKRNKAVSMEESYNFIPVTSVIARLEEIRGQRYVADFKKEDYQIAWQKDHLNLFRMNGQEIEAALLSKGFTLERKTQRIQIYETVVSD